MQNTFQKKKKQLKLFCSERSLKEKFLPVAKFRWRNQFLSFCRKDAFQNTGFSRLKCQLKRNEIDTACFQRFSKFHPTRKWVNKVNLKSFSTQNLFQILACVISARKARHLDIATMFTYSHANKPLGQSEGAYYLNYFKNSTLYP